MSPRLIALFPIFTLAALVRGAESLTLDQVLGDVRARNPQLRSATALAGAERERVKQVGTWTDPVAGLEIQRETTNRLASYDAAEFSVAQKIPLSGTRERQRALATAEANVSAAAIRSREILLLAEARDAFYQVLRGREQLSLTRETDKLLGQAVEITRSRLATGRGNVSALLIAETERSRLQERIISLDQEVADASAALNTLRDLPPQSPLGELIAEKTPSLSLPFSTLEEAQQHALGHRPELAEASARITAAQRARELADRAWRPDPEVTLKARHLNADHRVIEGYDTGVAISLPWFNDGKYRSAQREADKRREAAELDAAVLRTKTAAEIRQLWQRAETAQRNLSLYRDKLLPLAQQGADAARQGLINGSSSIAELVTAQRSLVEVQTALAANLADFHRYHALLTLLTGKDERA